MSEGPTLSPTELTRLRRNRFFAQVSAMVVLALGTTVLVLGWWMDVAAMRSVLPGLAEMKPNTALALVLLSSSVLLEAHSHPQLKLARALGALAALIGAANLIEYAGLDLGIDQLLATVRSSSAHPGRISIATSTALVLLGQAQALGSAFPAHVRLIHGGARAGLAIGLIALVGYLYDLESMYAFRPFETIAVHTAGSLLVLGVAILRVRGTGDSLFIADGAGGDLVRRLLPAATFLPPLLGWLCLAGMRAGLYDGTFALALFATSSAITLATLVFVAAARLQTTYQSLRLREQDLRITLRSIGDGVIATDDQGRITQMNPVAEHLTGWSLSDAAGQPVEEVFRIVHEETGEQAPSPVARVLREGTVVGLTHHTALIAKDGTNRAVADSGAPIRDDAGTLRGVVLVFRDQTEERRAQEAVDRFAHLATAGLFGVVVAQRDGTVEEVNDEFLRIVGRTRDEFEREGLDWRTIIPEEAQERSRAAIESLDTKGIATTVETEYCRKDGSRVPVLHGAAILAPQRSISFVLDRSGQQRAEQGQRVAEAALHAKDEQLRQSQKMEAIGQLAGGVAHDFNNLLAVILSYAQMMKAELPPHDPSYEAADEIEKAGLRAAQLTKQLLAFGRRQLLQPKSIDIGESLEAMGSLLRRLIGEDIELVLRANRVSSVFVDPSQMEQVLLNLAVNARDAMPRGGRLTIATTEKELAEGNDFALPAGVFVEVSVHDTGVGIDAESLPHIFEPFFTTKAMGKGTGLGLSTVQGIVSQSGGHVSVESSADAGTTFRVLLPRAPKARRSSVTESQSGPRPGGSETILLVEDDAQLRSLGVRILGKSGYQVLTAQDGQDALQKASEHQGEIHLMLTDVVMPRMGGRALADEIVKHRPGIKIIFMSGYTDDKVMEHGIATDAVSFLHKPIGPKELLAAVRRTLDEPA